MDHTLEGAVQISIGDNEYIGGENTASSGHSCTALIKATLDADGTSFIKNGLLLAKRND